MRCGCVYRVGRMWTPGGSASRRWFREHRGVLFGISAVVLVVAPLMAAAAREARHTSGEAGCRCTASLKLSGRPDLQFRGSQLTWVPRADVTIRTRGAAGGPDWSVRMTHEGTVSFSSADVTPPGDVAFSGAQSVASGACGNNRYTFRGMALPAMEMSGVTRSLVGERERLDGVVRMRAALAGCGNDAEARQFTFSVRELGNLRIGGWRSSR